MGLNAEEVMIEMVTDNRCACVYMCMCVCNILRTNMYYYCMHAPILYPSSAIVARVAETELTYIIDQLVDKKVGISES